MSYLHAKSREFLEVASRYMPEGHMEGGFSVASKDKASPVSKPTNA